MGKPTKAERWRAWAESPEGKRMLARAQRDYRAMCEMIAKTHDIDPREMQKRFTL